MPTPGFLVTLRARPGREDEVAALLLQAKTLVDAEPGTRYWYGFRLDHQTFGIFDVFDTEQDREIHLNGRVRHALSEHADLFETPPAISPVAVLDFKDRALTDR